MQPPSEPVWCWSIYQGAACLMGGDHAPNHAGSDLDGAWLRWTDEQAATAASAPTPESAS